MSDKPASQPATDLAVVFDQPSVFVNSASIMGEGGIVRIAFVERVGDAVVRPRCSVSLRAVDARAIADAILAALAVKPEHQLQLDQPAKLDN